ncbi:LacI family DNA-binding transcriptional regulator [Microbacterium sp. SORGH_AS_0888]|uniref:LacI family DNA-binding transcriptional regulator n=1 Tax=Microbacterium sp. SORGH_AS_0888 TaxID=3041791 RepID=UPI0027855981|nr:LacI family DNA-binding transcriptional regulator [Microbacterium sp. SORGH_AS_0888]MDQ1130349.1 DNA-binding LacI/PurR family transcriptional regulator [Microbacterium sp. SORGH_AS_0888]
MPHSPDRNRGVSMLDVARLAGVSGQTVSRVANNSASVSERTRDRVLAAMAELGYRPNVAARALRRGAFGAIGVVVFSLDSLGNVGTIGGILTDAAARGYAIELIQAMPATTDGEAVASAVSRLDQDAVDGIIVVIESHLMSVASVGFPPGMPSVVIQSGASADRPSVTADQTAGSREAVDHLVSLGHDTVWHIAGPRASKAAAERTAAWRSRLEELGRPVPPVFTGDWTPESGYRIGRELLEIPEVTAVFAANDQMALGAIRAMHESGRRVPEEISVVGFDDMAESAYFWPPLTTVHQDFGAAGSLAVSLVIDQIEGRRVENGVHRVPTSFVVRGSTAPRTPFGDA